MDTRIPKAVAAAAALALPLLAGCGGSPAPQASDAPSAPATSASASAPASSASASTSPSTSASASASASTKPADDEQAVEDASEKFVLTALTLDYAEGAGKGYAARVEPLMTEDGYDQVSSLVSSLTGEARSRFGATARSRPVILPGTEVRTLGAEKATSTVEFKPRVQRRVDGRWKTVKAAAVDETAKLTLVKEGDRWLVDKLS